MSRTVPCYNCILGKRGGCELCEKYGDGKGSLYEKYNPKVKKLIIETDKSKRVYEYPHYKCLYCRDTKFQESVLEIKELVNESILEQSHDIPAVHLPCSFCSSLTEKEIEAILDEKRKKVVACVSKNLGKLGLISSKRATVFDQVHEEQKEIESRHQEELENLVAQEKKRCGTFDIKVLKEIQEKSLEISEKYDQEKRQSFAKVFQLDDRWENLRTETISQMVQFISHRKL